LACPLVGGVLHAPLTIVIPPQHATDVRAWYKKGGERLPVEVYPEKILVQAAPSDQTIEVTWHSTAK
jgi:hypothetical protein